MKKIFFLPVLVIFSGLTCLAQTAFELVPSAGYTFPDQVDFYNRYGRIEGAAMWGGSVMFNVNRGFGVELMYDRVDTKSAIYNYGSQTPADRSDVAINYIMAGLVQSFNPMGNVHPFIGGLLGAAVFSPGPADYSGNTKFAWGAKLGANIYVSPRLGIRLQAQLLSPVSGSGSGYYFGNFGDAANGSGYASIYQFGLNAGLIIGMGRILPKPKPRIMYRRPAPRRYYSPYPPPPYYYH